MGCCSRPRTVSPPPHDEVKSVPRVKQEVVVRISECKVHLMDEGEAVEIAAGDFKVLKISDENVCLATTVKIGEDVQWPLTKDEPVVKLDSLHYLFCLPMKDGVTLSYGVTFSDHEDTTNLDKFLKDNSVFSSSPRKEDGIDWKEFAPAVDDYNNVLARAIAGGTGHIIKGIFICTNAYTNQVQKGGETMLKQAAEHRSNNDNKKQGSINKSLKRARNLSEMTEKMSKAMLDVVGVASGSVMRPIATSQPAKKFLSMVPGEVLLASLDAVNKIMDAAEAAEKQAMTATSGALTTAVSNRFGESAGEATQDALATVGHSAGTAWNVFKIRKAINPASSILNNAARK